MFDPSPIGIGLKNGYLQNLVLHNGSENHVSHVPFNIHLGGIPHFQTHPYHISWIYKYIPIRYPQYCVCFPHVYLAELQ